MNTSVIQGRFLCCLTVVLMGAAQAEVYLPGMQPKEAGIEFVKVQQCQMCHAGTKNGVADPMLSWQGGMMAQAARDPLFFASVTIANQDIPEVGEFCLRCHAPRAWLEDRSKPGDASALNREDRHGVNCEVCHRFVDPLSAEAKKLVKDVPPSYGNAMMVVDPANTVRGPYGNGKGAMPHATMKSDYLKSGHLCGVCHDISNPLLAKNVKTDPVHSFGHLERTYSEWVLSDYARQGEDGSCQSCHFPKVKGGGQSSRFGSLHRDYFVQHGPVGGSTWIQDAVADLWPTSDVNKKALQLGKERTKALLKTAAELRATPSAGNKLQVRVTNLTGHKLPSGYPEGRRMWLNVQFLNTRGSVIAEAGKYANQADTLQGRKVSVPTLIDPEGTTVYEVIPGISPAMAQKYKVKPGPSFHFVLNDVITKDNRIPPKGFNNEAFKARLCEPVGAHYADGQFWHETQFTVPPGAKRVRIRLMYQSMSWEYLKFLVEENRTDDWGQKLYKTWTKTGKCQPSVMAEIEQAL
jgi:hypothetical protein